MAAGDPHDNELELFSEPEPDEDDQTSRAQPSVSGDADPSQGVEGSPPAPVEELDLDVELAETEPTSEQPARGVEPEPTNGADALSPDDLGSTFDTSEEAVTEAGARDDREDGDAAPAELKQAPDVPPAPPGGPLPDSAEGVAGEGPSRPVRVIAIAGAKGGVGKTVLAANLGLYLATIGRRVVLVDADWTGANLHTCLGMRPPPVAQRLARRGEGREQGGGLEEALSHTSFQGLRLLHPGVDEPATSEARGARLQRLMACLRDVDADYVVVDLGAGLAREVLDAYLAADVAAFVTAPEPTAVENTYQFVRAVFARHLMGQLADEEARREMQRRIKALGGAPPPLDLLASLRKAAHPLASDVERCMHEFFLSLVINQTRLRADLELGFAMQSAARRRLGVSLNYLGHIDHDDTVWTCIRNRRPLLLESPGAKSSKKLEKIARRLLIVDAGKADPPRRPSVPPDSHHDLLEVERGATDEEARRAYKRCRETYSPEALCCYGLFEPHEVEHLRERIDEAFDVLLDPARRRPYELSIFPPEPEPEPEQARDQDDEPPPPPPDITPDTDFTGELLRQIRESQRVELHDISQRTKVGVSYLKAIEEDDFAKLPAPVYTSGFLTEYARFLRLDARQVSRTYVRKYKDYLRQRGALP